MIDILGGLFLFSSLIFSYLLVTKFLKLKPPTRIFMPSLKPKWKQLSYKAWVYHNPGDTFIFASITKNTNDWSIKIFCEEDSHTISNITTRQVAMLTVENWFN